MGWRGYIGLLLFVGMVAAGCQREPAGALRWRESINQLNEGAQTAYCRTHLYDAAAARAANEQLAGAERLFAALAYTEQIHERRLIAAIEQLGGGYTPPYRPHLFVYSTHTNLYAILHTPTPYGAQEVERVLSEGNRFAARLMVRHIASCNRCRRAVEHYLCRGEHLAPHYAVCPACGYLTDDRYHEPYCPQCGTAATRFRKF